MMNARRRWWEDDGKREDALAAAASIVASSGEGVSDHVFMRVVYKFGEDGRGDWGSYQ